MSDDNKDISKPVLSDEERAAKLKAAEEARAARAAAKAAETAGSTGGAAEETTAPKEPSPNQPLLDQIVSFISEQVGLEAIEQSYINERDRHLPYVIIKPEYWLVVAQLLRDEPSLSFNYLRNLSGVDQETHLEVVYHLLSMDQRNDICIKVKAERDAASVPSVTSVWATANWNEREVYDLLGVDFPGHPDLRRIMMPDDWIGHPLRKDYEPLDPEV